MTSYKSMDVKIQALCDRRAGEIAKWHIHWVTPAVITILLLAGTSAALAHHFFYDYLHGRPAEEQLKMIRYGTAMAFFVKSTLVGAVIMSYRQRIWRTFRTKAMTIRGIDGLFAATEDPTQFFYNIEMLRNGKLATLMAATSWLIPLASVLSPAALTTEMKTSLNYTTCASVATLNFSHEAQYDFRDKNFLPGSSLAFYNTTDRVGKAEGWFDYYAEPSKNARRLAVTSAYLKKPASHANASFNACGEGWNCTYSITFEGPGYKCEETSEGAPFNRTAFAPEGDSLYKASVDTADYRSPQIDTTDGVPTQPPPYPDSLGVFESEPVLWIGYARDTGRPYDDLSPFKKVWGTVHESKIFKCVAYHTNYTFEMSYNDTVQVAKRKERVFLKPIVDTTVTGPPGRLVANPRQNYISPRTDKGMYKVTAVYHSMNTLLRNFLRGDIRFTGTYITSSDLSETRLVDARTSYPIGNLMEEIQNTYEEMLITLMSEPLLVVADNTSVPCEKSRTMNTFVYHERALWLGYAMAVFATLTTILIGLCSMWQNGVASDTKFSRILVTTRNPTIDWLSVGACLGGDPFPKELRETKLRFGVLLEEEPWEGPLGKVEHCTFGTAGETKDIVKYGLYAGLRRSRREAEREKGSEEEKEALLSHSDSEDS
ncbi:hypothetical protein BU24DRAFT_436840 [Aaosphaeria arxii CBS 175.79]|uniref:Uncharacterized protein n=1 Tax=Aaosphaeria arxii CBS 175.79 TaxID=1450172 RepID=A0A6A5XAE2_9PLEO|nr:uncharacterized protein BU24DRAFT_436840 [Aaosphaeria arxii CBS 175.79]KAF2009948.1 hypothetical protein BU24DRAFT_436840 [Aaosphaeria arxii CBS 175.79]